MGHPAKRLTCVRRGPTLVGPYKGKDAAETKPVMSEKSAKARLRLATGGGEPGPYQDKGEKSPPFANSAKDGAPGKTPDMRQARADPSRPLQRQRRRRDGGATKTQIGGYGQRETMEAKRGLQEDFVQKRCGVSIADYAAFDEQANQLLR